MHMKSEWYKYMGRRRRSDLHFFAVQNFCEKLQKTTDFQQKSCRKQNDRFKPRKSLKELSGIPE